MIGLTMLLATGLALLWTGAVLAVAWMLTHPPRRTYAAAVARGRPGDPGELSPPRTFELWSFRSGGLDFPVWDIRGERPDGPTIILSHGWADSRIGGLLRIAALAPQASRLILWDSRGHGEAPGTCAMGTREVDDLLALIERVSDPAPVLYGWSLGAGASIAAASRHGSIRAVIAESPYRLAPTPARNVLRARALPYKSNLGPAMAIMRLFLGGGLSPRRFDRAVLAERLQCPLLVLHGEVDEVCPLEDGRDIAAAARHGRLAIIPDGRHNDLWTDPGLALRSGEAAKTFLAQCVESPRPGS